MRYLFLESVWGVFYIYEVIEELVGVGHKNAPGGANVKFPKGYSLQDGVFGVLRMTTGKV